jgi:predicted alpha/beta hydrolase family esterase
MFDRILVGKLLTALTILPILASCYFLKSTSVPIPYQAYIDKSEPKEHLVIFLPGLGDEPSAFSEAGFFGKDIFDTLPFDYLLVDSHLGYYTSRQLPQRFKKDILDDLATRYEKITLVGTSLGGLGAILLADENPSIIKQVVLIAPYMGNKETVNRVQQAGGLVKWYQQGAYLPADFDDREQSLIAWEGSYRLIYQHQINVIVSYGDEDGFAAAGKELAKNISSESVFIEPGGHKWRVWKKLWTEIIRANSFNQ